MKKKSHIYRGVASIFLALLVIFGLLGSIADAWSGKVNEMLGIADNTFQRSDDPEDYRFVSDYSDPADLVRAEIGLNTRLAYEGAVALKGQPALGGTRVSLFGMRSGAKMQFGGSMGELTDASNIVTLDQAMTENGFAVNPALVQFYKDMEGDYAPSRSTGGNIVSDYEDAGSEIKEIPVSNYQGMDVSAYNDAAVVVFGRDAGESACFYPGRNGLLAPEEFSQSHTGNILSLSNDERDLLNWVKTQGFGKIVVLLNSSTAMEIEELKQDEAIDAIVWIGNPGAYGTYGIAKLLSGEVLPSGHLPDTFAVNSAKSAAAQNYGVFTFANPDAIETTTNHALRAEWYLVESEGIYTGYKYYETRYFDCMLGQGNAAKAAHNETADGSQVWNYDNEVSYSFGYGVEGSTFAEEITGLAIDWSGETPSTATVRVTNTGSVAAKHAVQLYVSLPYTQLDRDNGVEKAAIQLVAYAKTGEAQEQTFEDVVLLEPGQSEELTLSFNAQDLYSYDRTYAHDGVQGAWLLETGDYWFATGNGAHDAVQAVLAAAHPEASTGLAPTGDAKMAPLSADTYLTTSNGVTIQNRLNDADLNNLGTDVQVTYLTRNDWANTFPTPVPAMTVTEEMIFMLRNQTYSQEAVNANYDGPTSFTYGAKNNVKAVQLIGLDETDPMYDKVLDEMTLQQLIDQYVSLLTPLTEVGMPVENRADSPLGIIGTIGQRSSGIFAVDKENEAFGRHTDCYVGAPLVAATFSPKLQSEEGRLIANDALWTGYHVWFGPGMNLHRTPYNLRNVGYYSEDSVLTGRCSACVHTALNEKGILTNTKHFAFNDQETNRDGLAVFLNEQAARENELRGFQIAIRDGGLKGLMTAFNRLGCTHVAAHQGLMNGILEGEWGYRGFTMTDSVKSSQYFLPRETILAANHQMLGGSNNGAAWGLTVDEVSKDPALQNALRESYRRKLYVYVNSAVLNGITPESAASNSLVWWALMLRIIMGLSFVGFVVYAVRFFLRERKERSM